MVEQLLDRVEPRRILRVQEDVHSEPACGLVDGRVLVYGSVVHEDHDVLVLCLLVHSQLREGAVQEVIEHDGVSTSFSYLGADHTVLGHGSNHRERVASELLSTFLAL